MLEQTTNRDEPPQPFCRDRTDMAKFALVAYDDLAKAIVGSE